jgi:aspartyl-tRNA(Asn)/glutamyl-tRNA(Gln) amidotransferase subunit B
MTNELFLEGALTVDANVSVNRSGSECLGRRTEVKNLNSIRSVVNAVEFEVERQMDVLESGGRALNETRSYDALTKETVPMRDKEVGQVGKLLLFCYEKAT